MSVHGSAGQREMGANQGEAAGHGGHGATLDHGEPPEEDPTLEHPRCVFQLLRRHYARYTPEFVEQVCGVPPDRFRMVAKALCDNSGRERTSAFCYAVGWTQHTVGVQYIRAAAIVQLLLGNIGRPGGGILALRGHASIQGSTDIPTLYNILPGYIPMPHAHAHDNLEQFIEMNSAPSGFWGNMGAYTVSLLKAYWGANATAENDFCFDYLPRITGDHSIYQTVLAMLEGAVRGMVVVGENPAVGSANSGLHRKAMAKLDWLVVRDLVEIETAAFWYDSPEVRARRAAHRGHRHRGVLPARRRPHGEGRVVHEHPAPAPVAPPGGRAGGRLPLRAVVLLPPRAHHPGEARAAPRRSATGRCSSCTGTTRLPARPRSRAPTRSCGRSTAPARTAARCRPTPELKDDGSTACGCWIYCGCYADETNQPARRKPGSEQSWVAPEWGWAWPANRRILYNRASADPEGKPWSERKRYVWWDEQEGQWTGEDVPDFQPDKRPDYVPPDGARAQAAIAGNHPFIMQADGRGWLFVPSGLVDGPLPTHYEPHESPFAKPPLRRSAATRPGRSSSAPETTPSRPTASPARTASRS